MTNEYISYNCCIVDDEINCAEVLAYEINKVREDVALDKLFTDPEEALVYLQEHQRDILFLDIEMPHLNGFELLEKLNILPKNVIFTTAYDQYAIQAFRYMAVDYLLKPIDRSLLGEAIEKAITNNRKLEKQVIQDIHHKLVSPNTVFNKIAVPVEQGYLMINISEIVLCTANSNYANILKNDGNKILISKPLKYLDEILNSHGFCRVHQSSLVNINYMESYNRRDGGIITLSSGDKVRVSKSRKHAFEKFLLTFAR